MILELFDWILNAQELPGSSFSPITAAFATQGYWMQGEILDLMTPGLDGWAALAYSMAAIGGLVSMVLGQPPKNYLWFFMGPGIYHWLLNTTVDVHGVAWKVAEQQQEQKEVWKLAEVGLKNMSIVQKYSVEVFRDAQPSQSVRVASMFRNLDVLVSDQVQWFIKWTGVYEQRPSAGGGSTNIPSSAGGSLDNGKWHILSNLKWDILNNITSAEAGNLYFRDSLTQFMTNECGDVIRESIDQNRYLAIINSKGATAGGINSVFRGVGNTSGGAGAAGSLDYSKVYRALSEVSVPIPVALAKLLKEKAGSPSGVGAGGALQGGGAFQYFSPGFRETPPGFQATLVDNALEKRTINCAAYFWTMVSAMRWESGHIYHQAHQPSEGGIALKEDDVIFGLFYGWDLRDTSGALLDLSKRKFFTKDLIFAHLMRNELSMLPQITKNRFSQTEKEIGYIESQQRVVGQKSKFAELYVWAKMMPYVQGLLLYFLALSYPFAVVMLVIPGWHKIIFTWASFFVWAKLWDVGFAIVTSLERGLWAMIGNNINFAGAASRVAEMQTVAKTGSGCFGFGGSFFGFPMPIPLPSAACPVPFVWNQGGDLTMDSALRLFDLGLISGASLDLDISNTYYIYLMSALYFAVPAVTGQLVLGAKSGAAGMVGNFTQGATGDASKGVGSGASGALQTRAKQAEQNIQQAAMGKGLRAGGDNSLAIAATSRQNAALQAGMQASYYGMETANNQAEGQVVGMRTESRGSYINQMGSVMKAGVGSLAEYQRRGEQGLADTTQGILGELRQQNGKDPITGLPVVESAPPGGRTSSSPATTGIGDDEKKPGWVDRTLNSGPARTIAKYGKEGTDALTAISSNFNQQEGIAGRHAALTSQGYNQIAQSHSGMDRDIDNMAAARLGTGADAAGAQAMYEATSSWGQDVAGNLSAAGVMAGTAAPSGLPTQREQMQSMGLLGGKASQNWNFPISGSARSEAAGYAARAQSSFGQKMGGFAPISGAGDNALRSFTEPPAALIRATGILEADLKLYEQ